MNRHSLGRTTILGLIVLSLFSFSIGSVYALGNLRELLENRMNRTTVDSTSTLPISSSITDSQKPQTAQDLKEYVTVGRSKRFYLLHIPKTYNPTKGTSLVIAYHGGMGTAQNMKNGFGLLQKSEKEGFIVAFPNGASQLKSGNFATWNAGECCGFAVRSESDDIGFTKKMVEKIKSEYKIRKTFAVGMSNGAMFSYKIACEIPELFDGIGAVAGTDNTVTCAPKEGTPVFHIHALNDDHVLYNGGCGPKCHVKSETEYTSVPDTIEKWKKINQCSGSPVRELSATGVVCDVYKNCASGGPVKLCTTDTGGHSWPGNPDRSNPRSPDKEPPSQAIKATDELWNFFKTLP